MKTSLYILLVCFFPLVPAIGQENDYHPLKDSASVREMIRKSSLDIHSIEASFVQVKHLDILENDIRSEGMFYFKRENKMRWEYDQPFKYIIVMTGDEILIKNENKVSAFNAKSNKLFTEVSRMMSVMLRGEIFDNPAFSVSLTGNKDFYLATAKPATKEMQQFLNTVYMYFEKKHLTVSKLRMLENSGDYTLITFHDKKINAEIPDSVFSLQ